MDFEYQEDFDLIEILGKHNPIRPTMSVFPNVRLDGNRP